ncbi:MAG: hypothetical protein KAX88_07790 [Rhodoferax sp.]|nr:hypothetical protein [Rhodoferax sp.]
MTTITIERAMLEQAKDAFAKVIEWDARRDYLIPYKVRDPVHAVQKKIDAALAAPATTQAVEIERLKTESEERLQNCAALVAENERLRAAPATAPEPVAWMHSKTGKLANSPYDISLADDDETAIPLYESPPLSEAEIQDLRDCFAARAMAAYLVAAQGNTPEPEQTANAAYFMSDAMMKAREQ